MTAAGDFTVQLPVYEGPLDLLLHLIEKRELDITQVSLAVVTDDYLAHLHTLEAVDPGRVAEFLVVAARLVLIKSRLLLPREHEAEDDNEDEGNGEALARALAAYRQFKTVARDLSEREGAGLRAYVREAPPPDLERRLDPAGLTVADLFKALRTILDQRAPEPESVDTVVRPLRVTVRQRINELTTRLRAGQALAFDEVLGAEPSRQEVIATFLALLELIKMGRARANQAALFAPIAIEPVMEVLSQLPEAQSDQGAGEVDEEV
ncbi:MAG TPA: hypothetical protein DEP84_00910 [Chloroflexi bacterium]|nr:hypothetical protein [Chloroflexota bacterium]